MLFGSVFTESFLISLESSFSVITIVEFSSTFFSNFQISTGSSSAVKFKGNDKTKIKAHEFAFMTHHEMDPNRWEKLISEKT